MFWKTRQFRSGCSRFQEPSSPMQQSVLQVLTKAKLLQQDAFGTWFDHISHDFTTKKMVSQQNRYTIVVGNAPLFVSPICSKPNALHVSIFWSGSCVMFIHCYIKFISCHFVAISCHFSKFADSPDFCKFTPVFFWPLKTTEILMTSRPGLPRSHWSSRRSLGTLSTSPRCTGSGTAGVCHEQWPTGV